MIKTKENKIKTKDSHKVDSEYEKLFDNALYEAGLDSHSVHPSIPGSKYSADFKIGDVYVEIWGVEDNKEYEKRKKEKKKIYKHGELNLKLVELNPEDFQEARKLRKKIETIKEKKTVEQEQLDENKNEKSLTSSKLDRYTIAKNIAQIESEEKMNRYKKEIERLNKKKEELQEKIEEIENEIKENKKKRRKVIENYM